MVRHLSELSMPSSPPIAGRRFLVLGLIVLALTACGRRGPLERPPGAAVQAPAARTSVSTAGTLQSQAAPGTGDDVDDEEEVRPAIVPTPPPLRSRRGHVIPREPFILDPLL
jgi:predicted small lipoprotein YifL